MDRRRGAIGRHRPRGGALHRTGRTRARQTGDEDTATRKLGRAVQLAAESGNESTTKLLRNVVEVLDEKEGTVKLRRNVNQADAMALDTRSTKTTRRASPAT